MADYDDFDEVKSGASETYPKQCSALRKGEYVILKGKPCKIVEMSTSKTGKHGHAKVIESMEHKFKSSLYLRYYAEAYNKWQDPTSQLSTWATQLQRNVAVVASRLRLCV